MRFLTQKKCCLLLVLMVVNTLLIAQAFQKKDAICSAGIGIPHLNKSITRLQTEKTSFKEGFKGAIQTKIKGTNPLCLKYEYALTKNFSLGLSFAWYGIEIRVTDSYTVANGTQAGKQMEDKYSYRLSSGSLGLRPNYHIPLESVKSDLFVGCAFGFTKNSLAITVSQTGTYGYGFADVKLPNGLYIAPTLGYRYYITTNLAFNLEVGYERGALMELGLAYRFRPYHYEPLK
ncbi:hypothetical protein CNR22_10550 [Sphingobacteriaceae bacterium]|nr:hypothetical protein CNR22_10550 [Sphingobacteriaceae bacterium]